MGNGRRGAETTEEGSLQDRVVRAWALAGTAAWVAFVGRVWVDFWGGRRLNTVCTVVCSKLSNVHLAQYLPAGSDKANRAQTGLITMLVGLCLAARGCGGAGVGADWVARFRRTTIGSGSRSSSSTKNVV